MAKGISELDVHNAADDLVALGERPTVERIRSHLGTGSPNTVTRWLETWWQTLGTRLRQRAIEAAQPGVPEPVASLTQRLWQAALKEAEHHALAQLQAERSALEGRGRTLDLEQASMRAEAEAAREQQRTAEAAAAAATTAGELLTVQVAQLTTQVQDLLRQRDGAFARGERLDQELEDARRAIKKDAEVREEQRRAIDEHVRTVEDRTHAEVDRQRMALLTAQQEWGREHGRLREELRIREEQITAAASREREAQRLAEGAAVRADGLEAQLASLKDATHRFTEALRHRQPPSGTTSTEVKQRRPAKRATALKSQPRGKGNTSPS